MARRKDEKSFGRKEEKRGRGPRGAGQSKPEFRRPTSHETGAANKKNLVVLGKRPPPHCYFTPLLTRPLLVPLLTGVSMAGFTHRPGFEIKIFQNIFYKKFPYRKPIYLLFFYQVIASLFRLVQFLKRHVVPAPVATVRVNGQIPGVGTVLYLCPQLAITKYWRIDILRNGHFGLIKLRAWVLRHRTWD
jgi:hypothetical protein